MVIKLKRDQFHCGSIHFKEFLVYYRFVSIVRRRTAISLIKQIVEMSSAGKACMVDNFTHRHCG